MSSWYHTNGKEQALKPQSKGAEPSVTRQPGTWDRRKWVGGMEGKRKVKVLVTHLCPTLCDPTPWTVAQQAPLSVEFSRQEYRSGLPFLSPGDLPDPEIEPGSVALQADSLPSEPPGKSEEKSYQTPWAVLPTSLTLGGRAHQPLSGSIASGSSSSAGNSPSHSHSHTSCSCRCGGGSRPRGRCSSPHSSHSSRGSSWCSSPPGSICSWCSCHSHRRSHRRSHHHSHHRSHHRSHHNFHNHSSPWC